MTWPTIILRVVAVGLLVVGVEQIAKNHPGLGGALSTFPLFTFASLILLSLDGVRPANLATFATAAALGLIPAAAAIATASLLLHRSLPLPVTLLAGAVIWATAAALLTALTPTATGQQ